MTMSADAALPTAGTTGSADTMVDLPVNPFVALRVAYGMLLGEDDFRTMMGNPRGKQMLHAAWLHGSGVVWGFGVAVDGLWTLKVAPGLALDGLGRELRTETTVPLDVRCLWPESPLTDGGRRTVHACLRVRFDSCPTAPVPTLADPCDVTRKHDDFSRVLERARVELRPGHCPPQPRPYHRVRVLLGLDRVGANDPAGEDARAARERVAACPAHDQPGELLYEFRRLAADDGAERRPATDGDGYLTNFPVADDDPDDDTDTDTDDDEAGAAVVLACVDVEVRDVDGRTEICNPPTVDTSVRTTLLPTATIQELVCGLGPTLAPPDDGGDDDAGGPRVYADRVHVADDGTRIIVPVSGSLYPGSVRRAVVVTSLSARGWVDEDVHSVRYAPEGPAIIVEMADRPVNEIVRVLLRGTGPTPVFGDDPPAPLAGVVGGPPCGHDGRDAVVTFTNPAAAHYTAEPRYAE
jgi:hypothetical protein